MRTFTRSTTAAALTLLLVAGCSGQADDDAPNEVSQYMGQLDTTDQGSENAANPETGNMSASNVPAVEMDPVTSDSNSTEGQDTAGSRVDNSAQGANAGNDQESSDEDPNPDTSTDEVPVDDGDLDEESPVDADEQDLDDAQEPEPEPEAQPEPEPEPEPEPVRLDVEFPELYQTIFLATCAGGNCHGSNAQRAPFGADDEQFAYDVITANSQRVLDRLQGNNGGIMPRGCGGGLGQGRCLTQAQFDAVQAWVDADMPR